MLGSELEQVTESVQYCVRGCWIKFPVVKRSQTHTVLMSSRTLQPGIPNLKVIGTSVTVIVQFLVGWTDKNFKQSVGHCHCSKILFANK